MPKTMRKFLRKPASKETTSRINWRSLYQRTVEAVNHLDPEEHETVRFLLAGKREPEQTLRKLSIICDEDIKREFGSLT